MSQGLKQCLINISIQFLSLVEYWFIMKLFVKFRWPDEKNISSLEFKEWSFSPAWRYKTRLVSFVSWLLKPSFARNNSNDHVVMQHNQSPWTPDQTNDVGTVHKYTPSTPVHCWEWGLHHFEEWDNGEPRNEPIGQTAHWSRLLKPSFARNNSYVRSKKQSIMEQCKRYTLSTSVHCWECGLHHFEERDIGEPRGEPIDQTAHWSCWVQMIVWGARQTKTLNARPNKQHWKRGKVYSFDPCALLRVRSSSFWGARHWRA